MRSDNSPVLTVNRTKAQAKQNYDRMSRFYDLFAGGVEQTYRNQALNRLNIAEGETVLEIGFGTGQCLVQMAKAVGTQGKVYGVELSTGMLEAAQKRLHKAGLAGRVDLLSCDAMQLPYTDGLFDAVFMSFVLELFEMEDNPLLLAEIGRVLKPGGRLGVISMSKGDKPTFMLRLYEWLHRIMPKTIDCRPIYTERIFQEAGFTFIYNER
ncbi:MAG TPA: class I SAM-dependent methyltransferase, partial [Longilinea sp.]|nr:class I SAM-dependent methyltransferase [Longilinea sp.]